MDSIVILILIIGLFAILCLVGYFVYDYQEYKKKLSDNLKETNKDINYNFDKSTSNLVYIKDVIQHHSNIIDQNISNINKLDYTIKDQNNIISTRLSNTSNEFNKVFNSFNNNLNKYFEFDDGGNDISKINQPNNKIFNYIFGANLQQNLELIANTTAHSGITILSEIGAKTNFMICNSNMPSKCVKMATDIDGNFNIIPAGANNITFQNLNGHTFAQFNMQNNDIYLGGSNIDTAPFYIKDKDVYVKNLRLISANDNKISRLYNYEEIFFAPIYTVCTLTNTKNTTDNKYNTTIDIVVKFNTYYNITNHKQIYIDIAQYVNISKFATIIFSTTKQDVTQENINVVNIKKFKNSLNVENKNGNVEYISGNGNLIFKFIDTNEIAADYELNIVIQIYNSAQNITNLPDDITSFKFITSTYFIKNS